MGKPLRVLVIEDSEDDALLAIRLLQKGGYDPTYERVETAEAMGEALEREIWDIIVSDYKMPHFNGLAALKLYKEKGLDIPFIIVSGTIGEELAVEAMKIGAHDYVMKKNLSRLVPAVQRELKEAESRRERKRAEEALRESEERYKALFDRSLDLVYITDFEGRFIDANDATLNRLGYTREEIASLNFASLLSEDQLPLAFKRIQETREIGIQKSLLELRVRHKDGSDVYVETQGSIVMSNGTPVAIQAIARDITDRKQAEEKLSQTLENLRKAMGGIIQVISDTVETRDPYTSGHQRRVADLARAIAQEIGLADDQLEGLVMAGIIHDLGKVSIPAEILSKPIKLSEIEYQLIQAHSQIGYDILKGIEFPWPVAAMVLQHHERMNGSGYPQGLKGEDILLEARILMVADVVEAMASHRPYRPALGIDAALEEIEKNKGILYDPEVTEMCLWLFREKGFRFE